MEKTKPKNTDLFQKEKGKIQKKREQHQKPKQTLITMYGKRKGEEELEEEEERERKCWKFSRPRISKMAKNFEDRRIKRRITTKIK